MPLTQSPDGAAARRWPVAMENPIRDYDWGSTTVLPRLQGRSPSGRPEAELWVGAHPAAPSWLLDGDDRRRLDLAIAEQPELLLGPDCLARFGPRLPFLTKLLAIDRALSVQVHPSAEQAAAGYPAERAAGGPPPGGYRYSDPFPKPELVYPLSPMDVLAGCRPAGEAAELLGLILDRVPAGPSSRLALLRRAVGGGVPEALGLLAGWSEADRAELADEATIACRPGLGAPDGPLRLVSRLAEQHPGDPLVIAPALLRLIRLPVGATMYLPAGVPHAYLSGFGLEVMAPSDNVVRAGLTSKPVDADALVALLNPAAEPQLDLPGQQCGPAERCWQPPTPWFRLCRVQVSAGAEVTLAPVQVGPQVLLCTRGTAVVGAGREQELTAGRSLFLGAACGPVRVRGEAELFRTTVGCLTSEPGPPAPAGS
jgi:mannose-6-phosphate isomerase